MTAALYFPVLRKELRRFLPWAILVIVSILLNRFLAPYAAGSPLQIVTFWTSLLPWPLVFVSGLLLGQEDQAIGDHAFWHTRPVPGLTLVATKLSALLLLIILPAAANDMSRAALHDLHGVTLSLIGLERALFFGTVATVGLYLGATNRSLLRSLSAVVSIALTAWIILFTASSSLLSGHRLSLTDPTVSSNDRLLVGFVGFLLLSGALLMALYHTRRAYFVATLAALGTIAVGLTTTVWPYPLLPRPRATTEPALTVPEVIDLRIDAPWRAHLVGRSPKTNQMVAMALSAQASITPRATFVTNINATGQITLPDGRTQSLSSRRQLHILDGRFTANAIRESLGMPDHNSRELGQVLSIRGVNLPLSDLIQFTGQTMALDLNLTYEAHRILLDQRLPLATGATVAHEGLRQEVTGIFAAEETGGLRLHILRSSVTSMFAPFGELRPDQLQFYRPQQTIVLIHRTTGAISTGEVEGRPTSSPTDETFPTNQHSLVFRYAYLPNTTDPNDRIPVDTSWRGHCDIVFLHSAPLGSHTQHDHFDEIKIPRPVIELTDREIDLRNW